MGEFIGLNPILIFIALLVGVQMAGVFGVIVAVPIAGTVKGTIDAIRLRHQPQGASPKALATHQPSTRLSE